MPSLVSSKHQPRQRFLEDSGAIQDAIVVVQRQCRRSDPGAPAGEEYDEAAARTGSSLRRKATS